MKTPSMFVFKTMKNFSRTVKRTATVFLVTACIMMVIQPRGSKKLLRYNRSLDEEFGVDNMELRAKGPLEAQDPNLLRLLRDKYLAPPSSLDLDLMLDKEGPEAKNYNVYRTGFASWVRINGILKKLFSSRAPGFFLEAGALDGEFISNTLFLERELGWTGLLIEADPVLYSALPGKHRRSWSSQSCISPDSYAQVLNFETYRPKRRTDLANELLIRSTGNLEGVNAPAAGQMGLKASHGVQCFPMISYLLALNTTKVDYISLDVEGAEANILLKLPWDQINVTVWTIEHRKQNTGFRDFYLEPGGVKPPVLKRSSQSPLSQSDDSSHVEIKKKVVYITQHDPASGKDDYFVLFMKEKGYTLYDYWDGDYTFIKSESDICKKHCSVV